MYTHIGVAIVIGGCGVMVVTDFAPIFIRHLFPVVGVTAINVLGCRMIRHTLLGIADVRSRVATAANQDTIRFQYDVELSDAFSTNGMGAEGISSDIIDLT